MENEQKKYSANADTNFKADNTTSALENQAFFQENFLSEIKSRWREILPPDRSGKGVICPHVDCQNGTGRTGDGLRAVSNGSPVLKCFKCGRSGDIIKFIQEAYHYSFADAVKVCADKLHLDLNDTNHKPHKPSAIKLKNKIETPETDFTDFIEEAHAHLEETDYWKRRGLSLETCIYFNIGYAEKWKHPIVIEKEKSGEIKKPTPFTPRLIIPTSDFSYLARDIRTNIPEIEQDYTRSKVGKVHLFNIDALKENIAFVVEGEIDAMSLYEVGANAVAIGSANNTKQLIEAVKKLDTKPEAIIIALDRDETGKKFAKLLFDSLKKESVPAVINSDIYGKHKDANEALCADREQFKKNIDKAKTDALIAVNSPKAVQERIEELANLENPTDEEKKELINLIRQNLDHTDRGPYKGKVKNSSARNFLNILRYDPYLKNCVGYNEFSYSLDVLRNDLPWRKRLIVNKKGWTDHDDARVRNYINQTYENLNNDKLYKDAMLEVVYDRAFHPIQNIFKNLPDWDGIERAETLFIDSVGVTDNKYSRELTMHWLMAAVARIFNPGCKFDPCLVLKGEQGIGKSTILRKLAINEQWYNNNIRNITNKDAMQDLQGYWIIELEELKALVNAVNDESSKGYISSTTDKFRPPYGKRTEEFPRQCVFAASTNNEEFLKDLTGGRRWWILTSNADMSTTNERLKKFNKDYITQIWAEVYFKYQEKFADGFDDTMLMPDYTILEAALSVAKQYTIDDGMTGQIEAFLEKKIPDKEFWDNLPMQQRREFLQNGFCWDNSIKIEGTRLREYICPLEIIYECFGLDAKNHGKSRRINEILAHMPNLISIGSKKYDPFYGKQRAYKIKYIESVNADDTKPVDEMPPFAVLESDTKHTEAELNKQSKLKETLLTLLKVANKTDSLEMMSNLFDVGIYLKSDKAMGYVLEPIYDVNHWSSKEDWMIWMRELAKNKKMVIDISSALKLI